MRSVRTAICITAQLDVLVEVKMSKSISDELDEILGGFFNPAPYAQKEANRLTNQAKQAILKIVDTKVNEANKDSLDKCLEIIKGVNEKLFMYEVLMGKIDYKYNGKDTIKQFMEYQELEPERTKFADWLEAQSKENK